jgi:glycosyltransferase involved in cell wall biosynthesis
VLLQALVSYGVPCVTTDIGAEGSGLKDMENILIANRPDEMCSKIIRCYNDPVLWNSISIKGNSFFRHNFSIDALQIKISGLLADLKRKKYGIGE